MILKEQFKDLTNEKLKSLLARKNQEVKAIKEILKTLDNDKELKGYQAQNLLLLTEEIEVKGRQEVMILANLIQILNNELTKTSNEEEKTDD